MSIGEFWATSANAMPSLTAPAAPPLLTETMYPLPNGVQQFSPTEFQLPPELFEDWPWPLEMGRGQDFGFPWPGVDPTGCEIAV